MIFQMIFRRKRAESTEMMRQLGRNRATGSISVAMPLRYCSGYRNPASFAWIVRHHVCQRSCKLVTGLPTRAAHLPCDAGITARAKLCFPSRGRRLHQAEKGEHVRFASCLHRTVSLTCLGPPPDPARPPCSSCVLSTTAIPT